MVIILENATHGDPGIIGLIGSVSVCCVCDGEVIVQLLAGGVERQLCPTPKAAAFLPS